MAEGVSFQRPQIHSKVTHLSGHIKILPFQDTILVNVCDTYFVNVIVILAMYISFCVNLQHSEKNFLSSLPSLQNITDMLQTTEDPEVIRTKESSKLMQQFPLLKF